MIAQASAGYEKRKKGSDIAGSVIGTEEHDSMAK
jgi:hypothetical protein